MTPRPPVPRPLMYALLGLAAVELLVVAGAFLVWNRRAPDAAPAVSLAVAAPADARQRGVCFVAGPPVSAAAFDDLVAHGVSWISQTPFGWQGKADEPTFRMVTEGRIYWGERDSGLVVTARLARAHGIHTLLKPHLWLRDRSDGQWWARSP